MIANTVQDLLRFSFSRLFLGCKKVDSVFQLQVMPNQTQFVHPLVSSDRLSKYVHNLFGRVYLNPRRNLQPFDHLSAADQLDPAITLIAIIAKELLKSTPSVMLTKLATKMNYSAAPKNPSV